MQLPADILSSAETNILDAQQLIEWCALSGMSAVDACNALALEIAREYGADRLDFVFCDRVINSLMNAVTTEDFFAISDRTVPEQLSQVYFAFDAGEYVHAGDSPVEDQEAKYTRPKILLLLARAGEA